MSWVEGVLLGVVATFAMDVWALVPRYVLRLPTTNWALVGRWFGHMPRGTFVHRPISAAAPVRGEHALGWTAHYLIGIAYGIAYVPYAYWFADGEPSIAAALSFALALLVFPWLVMQPALGAGVFARNTPRPTVARLLSISMHTAFGVGLYVGTRLVPFG